MTNELNTGGNVSFSDYSGNLSKLFSDEELTLNEAGKIRRWVRSSKKEMDSFRKSLASDNLTNLKDKAVMSEREGISRWILKEREEAKAAFSNAGTELSHCFYALCLKEEGKEKEALEYLNGLTGAIAESRSVILTKLKLMYFIGKFDENADKLIGILEKKYPDDIETLKVKGMYFEECGQQQKAIDLYRHVLDLEPDDEEILFCIAGLLDRYGLDDEALLYYEKAADLFPVRINSVLNLGQIYYERGENEKAIFCFKRILKQFPDHSFSYRFVRDISATENMYYDEKKAKQVEELNKKLQIPVTDFELSVRSRNCLSQMNIKTLGDLIQKTEADLLSYKNFGETSLAEIKRMLSSKGLYLGMAKDIEDQELKERQKRQTADSPGSEILQKSIETLELSIRAGKCLERLNVKTLGDLVQYDEPTLLKVRNFGQTSLNEIKKKLTTYDLSLKNE